MGNFSSKPEIDLLSSPELNLLANQTNFTPEEIQEYYHKFNALSSLRVRDHSIDLQEFQQGFEIKNSEFAERLFNIFDFDKTHSIEFQEFIQTLSPLAKGAPFEEKVRFVFSIYDKDQNGSVDRNELREILRFTLLESSKRSLNPKYYVELLNDYMSKLDSNSDGKITFEEFFEFSKSNSELIDNLIEELTV
jgi:serine/threonine-protein phosphatase 2B regulatory subunit